MVPSKRTAGITAILLLVAVLASPLVLYVIKFGLHLSSDHERWGQAGDFLGAAYGTIAAFMTLLILLLQARMQSKFSDHEYDQAFIGNSRSDLNYYIEQISIILSPSNTQRDISLADHISTGFSNIDLEHLNSEVAKQKFEYIHSLDDRVVSLWQAINCIIHSVKNQEDPAYELFYEGSKQKCAAMLGYRMCVALDNLHYVGTKEYGGHLLFDYLYSQFRRM